MNTLDQVEVEDYRLSPHDDHRLTFLSTCLSNFDIFRPSRDIQTYMCILNEYIGGQLCISGFYITSSYSRYVRVIREQKLETVVGHVTWFYRISHPFMQSFIKENHLRYVVLEVVIQ